MTSSSVEIFFLVMATFSCLPLEMENGQIFFSVGFCLPSVEFWTSFWAVISSCAWEVIFFSAAVSAPTLEPQSLPDRQSGRRPCDGAPSWRPRRSRTRYRQTLGGGQT